MKNYTAGNEIHDILEMLYFVKKGELLFWQKDWNRPVHYGWLSGMQFRTLLKMIDSKRLCYVKKINK